MLGPSTLPLYYMCIIQYNIQYIVVMLLCYVFLVENLSFAGICPKWSQMAGRAGNSPGELKIFRARPSGALINFLISNPVICPTGLSVDPQRTR